MKKYTFITQEDPHYCLPACLQMILEENNYQYDSQEKILKECGDEIRNNNIEKYLKTKNYPLHSEDFLVNQSLSRDFDKLVEEALNQNCDILVGYAFDKLHNTEKEGNHVSILYDYEFNNDDDNTILIDPNVKHNGIVHCNFDNLVRAMFTVSGGFHIIHPSQKILEQLREYF